MLPTEPQVLPLGPQSAATSLPRWIACQRNRHTTVVAALFIAIFAFLLASFPARNPDVWGHLAEGRALFRGQSPIVTASWAHEATRTPGWLFDLSAYGIYSTVGGGGLVLIKAMLVAGLGLIMLRSSWTRESWLIPLFCVGLALLAIGSRLLLQPATVSYFFLGLTWWLVRRRDSEEDRVPACPPMSLLVLFVLWANTDRWFLAGLGVVGLVWLGRALDRPAQGRFQVLLRRGAALAMLAAACLINPAHISSFSLPPELLAGGARAVRSPFQSSYLETVSASPAGLAYYPLLGLGLVSFALARWRWDRFLPWAALAALSAVQVRTVPLFAVVAGPVLAWNLEDFFSRRVGPAPATAARSRLGRVALRGLGGLLGLAFLACAWTGWLQAPPFEPRRWAIETPPALQRGAEAVCRWQADGRLGSNPHGLHLSPDSVATFAWFCPTHRSVQDSVLAAGVVGDPEVPDDWIARMRSAGINHVVVYDTDRHRLVAALGRLLADPAQWPLLHLEGGLTIFGWRDPARTGPDDLFHAVEQDPDRLALWPSSEQMAPLIRPAQDPEARRWWEAFWKYAPPPPIDRDAAALYLLQAEVLRQTAAYRHLIAWEATQAAGLVSSAGGWAGPRGLFDAQVRFVFLQTVTGPGASTHPLGSLALAYQQVFTRARDDTPAAIIYLAIRAARRALMANPRDAQAHATLGEAYLRLLQNTRERTWARPFSELGQLRRAQAAAALTNAVALDPNLAQAHLNLGALYGEMGFLDLALKHQREYLAAVRNAGRGTGIRAEEYRDSVAEVERQVVRLAELVERLELEFAREAAGLRVLDRAALARDLGLAGKARDILLESDISAFGAIGMALELELLVRTGRAKEVRDWTATEHQEALGPMYHWLRVQALAATGDYALAEIECNALASDGPSGSRPGQVIAVLAGQSVCDGNRTIGSVCGGAWDAFRQSDFRGRLRQLLAVIRRQADAITLRGLLQLEVGETEAAAADFRRALAIWGGEAAAAQGRGIDFNGRVVAQATLAWIESVPAPRDP